MLLYSRANWDFSFTQGHVSTFTFVSGKYLISSYAEGSKLPISFGKASPIPSYHSGFLSLAKSRRLNISKVQEELPLWYTKLGHYVIKNTQHLVSKEVLPVKHFETSTCNIPMCRTYVAGKGKRLSDKSTSYIQNKPHADVRKKVNI